MALKWIGAVMVIGGGGAMGFCYGRQFRGRLEQLCVIRQILYMLKGEISYSASTLAEAFATISLRTPPPFQTFLECTARRLNALEGDTLEQIWRQEIRQIRKETYLTAEDTGEWESMGNRLGYLDGKMQQQLIDLFLTHWEEKIRQLEQECGKTCRLYQYLGVLAGLLLTVILL